MKVIAISLLLCATLVSSDEDGRYFPDNSGQYVPDNSGQYVDDGSGRYRDDGTGRYKDEGNGRFTQKSFNGGPTGGFGNRLDFSESRQQIRPIPAPKFTQNRPSIRPQAQIQNQPIATNPGNYGGKSPDGKWRIIKLDSDVDLDNYRYNYETENKIIAEESGKLFNAGSKDETMRSKGYYQYTGPDNVVYSVSYTADENGFIAEGEHLPTPPPVPDAIAKALNL